MTEKLLHLTDRRRNGQAYTMISKADSLLLVSYLGKPRFIYLATGIAQDSLRKNYQTSFMEAVKFKILHLKYRSHTGHSQSQNINIVL